MKLYIDPGTGSMLFTILIGVIGASIYSIRMLIIKLRFKLSGGKAEANFQKIPFAVYADDKRYWPVFKPVCEELSRRGKEVVYMTSSSDDPALQSDMEHFKAEFIGADNRAFTKLNFLNGNGRSMWAARSTFPMRPMTLRCTACSVWIITTRCCCPAIIRQRISVRWKPCEACLKRNW